MVCGSVAHEVAVEGLGFPMGYDLVPGFQPQLGLSLWLVCGCALPRATAWTSWLVILEQSLLEGDLSRVLAPHWAL